MKDCRIYILTALFLCLTAVKFCFPVLPARIGREMSRMICCQADYAGALQAMGRAIGRGQLVQTLNDLLPGAGESLISAIAPEESGADPSPAPSPRQS